ncbi:MAG: acyltransferase family protein [Candidatus Aenigmatarchaeota archaeon]
MKGRIIEIDFIKGVVIFLMVFGHITFIGSYKEHLELLKSYIYTFHMPVFLVISGYFATNYFSGFRENMKKITRRIFIPYLIFGGLYIISLFIAQNVGFSVTNKIENLDAVILIKSLLTNPIGAYWYLHTLSIFLFTVVLVRWLSKDNTLNFIILLLAFVIFIPELNIGVKLTSLVFLFLGILASVTGFRLVGNFWAIILVIFIFSYYRLDVTSNLFTHAVLVFGVMSSIIFIASKMNGMIVTKLFTFVGRNTLAVLVLHTFVINLFKIPSNLFLRIEPTGILYTLITSVAGTFLPIFATIVFDKLKISPFLFGKNNIYNK